MIVDDDPDIQQALRFCLEDYDAQGFTSGDDAILAASQECFPVVILDLNMAGISGLETLQILKNRCPQQQVIILTGQANTQNAVEALNLGAFRYVIKPFRIANLLEHVDQAFEKFERELSAAAYLDTRSPALLRNFGLTPREAEICSWIMLGKTNAEIADALEIFPRTVEKHLEKIFAILQVKSRISLVEKIRCEFWSNHWELTKSNS